MAKISVYYDYHDDVLAPIWMFISFGRRGIEWNRQKVYIPIESPFQRIYLEEINEDTVGLTIQLDDLTVNPDFPGSFGIDLAHILRRIRNHEELHKLQLDEVEQFIIQIADLEELLQMDVRKFYRI
ncbi:hypothetical protein [Paenibacillus rigui]|uniref:Uncharacterized protein n=1 Tax=Paenibacillus rigui TaxID=554312 RepID=A0A229UR74_9BACL|nr:hypothetical protein [Paenibacillus rigui]OXM85813.1 hypothetical protein CF651_11285 [Paenibacillus rigui]